MEVPPGECGAERRKRVSHCLKVLMTGQDYVKVQCNSTYCGPVAGRRVLRHLYPYSFLDCGMMVWYILYIEDCGRAVVALLWTVAEFSGEIC
jgi:hypothetical protein